MGSSPIRQHPAVVQKEAVASVENLTKEQQRKYNVKISQARAQYRKDMPTIHKDKPRKRRKFVKEYMSKFKPPDYTASVKKEKVSEKPVVAEKIKPPSTQERSQYYYGSATSPPLSELELGERASDWEQKLGIKLTKEREEEVGDWIASGKKIN